MPPTDQSANGDGNTQIGGDGNVAGRDITNIIQGVPPSEHAKALAQIEILKGKLAIAQAADKEDPTEEEILAAEEAMEVAEDLEEMGAELNPWNYLKLGDAAELRGRTITAAGYYREALRLFLESGDRSGEAASLVYLGIIADTRGDLDEAERLYNESLAIQREIGDRYGEAASLNNLGNIAGIRGDLDEAERLIREVVRINNEIGIPLDDWFVENGYTDPDAPWNFPPPPPAASEEDES